MGLKLRVSYIVLAVSIVILAIGIILITNHFVTEPPVATTLVDRTVVVQAGEQQRFDFNVPRTGTLKITVEVMSGGIVDFDLLKDSRLWWNGEEGFDVIRSSLEVPIDAGTYCLVLYAPKLRYWWSNGGSRGSDEDRVVSVYLGFES